MLKAVEKIVALAEEKNITFPEAVLLLDSKESGISGGLPLWAGKRMASWNRLPPVVCVYRLCRNFVIPMPLSSFLRSRKKSMKF